MTYEDAIRILLNGTTGANVSVIYRATRIRNETTASFLAGHHVPEHIRDRIALFTWRRMNAAVLLGDSDEDVLVSARKMPRKWSRQRKGASNATTSMQGADA